MTDFFQNFINEIDMGTLWEPLNSKYPEIGHISIPDKLKDIKEFPLSALMAELLINNLRPMKFSSWMGSPWFYVCLILALAIVIGLCIKKGKTVRKLGCCCGGCWTRCHGRPSDGGERDSPGSTSYSCVDPEARTSKQNIELRDISNPKKLRRSRKLEARKTVHNTGTTSESLAQRFRE